MRALLGRERSAAAASSAKGRTIDIGWLLDTDKARFIWEEPRRKKPSDPSPTHAKSVTLCPSVRDHEARTFEVPCPIDVRLAFRKDEKGQPALSNLDGDMSAIRGKHLNQMLAIVAPREWRHPNRPVIQLMTPYVFLSDEPVWMTQIEPIGRYRADPWPGVMIGGRLPIHIWPRPMMWAFEWHDVTRPLVLKRGEPWFSLLFETMDPARPFRLFEAERTPEVIEHMQGLSAVSNYVDKTFSLFKTAQARRPARLLVRKSQLSENEAPAA